MIVYLSRKHFIQVNINQTRVLIFRISLSTNYANGKPETVKLQTTRQFRVFISKDDTVVSVRMATMCRIYCYILLGTYIGYLYGSGKYFSLF